MHILDTRQGFPEVSNGVRVYFSNEAQDVVVLTFVTGFNIDFQHVFVPRIELRNQVVNARSYGEGQRLAHHGGLGTCEVSDDIVL